MLKPLDCEINDTFTGYDPCPLAVLLHIEPGELTSEACTFVQVHSKAALHQPDLSKHTELDSTFISSKTHRASTVRSHL